MYRILTFGGLSVVDSAGVRNPADIPRRRLALLLLLAAAGERGLSRDKLLGYLWPESEAERARHSLNQALYGLRRDLRSEGVVLGASDLRLNAQEVSTDVGDFEGSLHVGALQAAVRLYAGPFADGFFLSEAAEFERWLESERGRLAGAYAHALDQLAREAEQRGEHAAAAGWWRRLAAHNPLNADVARRLMASLAAAGDHTGALQHARVFEALLQDELGVSPDTATYELVTELRATRTRRVNADANAGEKAPAAPTPEGPAESARAPRATPWSLVRPDEAFPAPTATPAPRAPRARRSIVVLALLVLLVVVVAASYGLLRRRSSGFESKRVLVAVLENQTGDPAFDALGVIAADWVIQGLVKSQLVDVVDAETALMPWRSSAGGARERTPIPSEELAELTGAQLMVRGDYHELGSTIELGARVVDARTNRVLRVVTPVRVSQWQLRDGVGALRRNVMSALSAVLNPSLASWARTTEVPPTYDAYAEYVHGLDDSWRDGAGAAMHFLRANEVDSTFVTPLLHAAEGEFGAGNFERADSLVQATNKRRERLTQYETYVLDYLRAAVRGDVAASYEFALLALQALPGSPVARRRAAYVAIDANHQQKAVELLSALSPDVGSCVDCDHYWWQLTSAEHMLGQYDRELADAQRGIKQYPALLPMRLNEIRALAALGRVDEVQQRVDASLVLHASGWFNQMTVFAGAAQELRAHGHEAAAQRVVAKALAWLDSLPDYLKTGGKYDFGQATILLDARRWKEAEAAFQRVLLRNPDSRYFAGFVAAAAVRAGDSSTVNRVRSLLEQKASPYDYGMQPSMLAKIAALEGRRDLAVELLRESFARGRVFNVYLHVEPYYESLWGFPPYEGLMRPRG